MRRTDRRELAVLGLLVLGWGLLVSPLLHRESHLHGVAHSHGGAPSKSKPAEQHGAGSIEHQSLSFSAAPVAPSLTLTLVAVQWTQVVQPLAPSLSAQRRVEQSQAP